MSEEEEDDRERERGASNGRRRTGELILSIQVKDPTADVIMSCVNIITGEAGDALYPTG